MNSKILQIIEKSKDYGWILEPDAKELLKLYNLKTTDFIFTKNIDDGIKFLESHKRGVVCKIVSPKVIHKSESGGVIVGIKSKEELENAFDKISKIDGFLGVLVENMLDKGFELIAGAKNDLQFGPIVMLGMGGVSVEIYKDSSIRMAPLTDTDIDYMLTSLKCYPLLKGYRGEKGVDIEKLKSTIKIFSNMVMEIRDHFESIDLNPLICSPSDCLIADARIML